MSYTEIDLTPYTMTGGKHAIPGDPSNKSKLLLTKRDASKIDKLILHHAGGWSAGESMIDGWSERWLYLKKDKNGNYIKDENGNFVKDDRPDNVQGVIHTQWQVIYLPNYKINKINIGGKTLTNGIYFIKNYNPDIFFGGHSSTGIDSSTIGIEVAHAGWGEGGTITQNKMIEDGFNSNGCKNLAGYNMYEYSPEFSYALGQWCNTQCNKYNIPKVLLCDYNATTKEWLTADNIDDFKSKINFSNLNAPFSQFKGITYHFHATDEKLDITPSLFYGQSGINFFKGFKNGGFGGSGDSENIFEIDVTSGKTYHFYFESDYFLKKDSLTQTLMSPIYSNPTTSNQKIYNDKIKNIVKQIVYSKFSTVYNLDPNEMSLVPLEFNMVVDGISGLSIGDVIECDFLPETYQKNTIILITGVENNIVSNEWKTNLKVAVKAILKKEENIDSPK